MNGVASPFLITLGVISYRWFKQVGEGPPPISFAGAAVIFGACGVLEKANHKFGTTLAWGFLLAATFSPAVNSTTVGKIAGDPTSISGPAAGTGKGTTSPSASGAPGGGPSASTQGGTSTDPYSKNLRNLP